MKYLNAQVILPNALGKEPQTYVQGGYIYVPIEREQQKRWGEASGYLCVQFTIAHGFEIQSRPFFLTPSRKIAFCCVTGLKNRVYRFL